MTDASAKQKYDREAALRALAVDMQRQAAILEREIKAEEDRSHRHDPSDVTYTMLARSLRQRHHNVSLTLATLSSEMQPASGADEASRAA
jgi:hypothetical protein